MQLTIQNRKKIRKCNKNKMNYWYINNELQSLVEEQITATNTDKTNASESNLKGKSYTISTPPSVFAEALTKETTQMVHNKQPSKEQEANSTAKQSKSSEKTTKIEIAKTTAKTSIGGREGSPVPSEEVEAFDEDQTMLNEVPIIMKVGILITKI